MENTKNNILVSACLLGVECRYDGKGSLSEQVTSLQGKYNLIPVCPEMLLGGVSPREPVELINGRAIDKYGKDYTEHFIKGANEVLRIARLHNCKVAILKSNSPSCGSNRIYDGTFSHTIISGDGITAELLKKNGINVMDEKSIKL